MGVLKRVKLKLDEYLKLPKAQRFENGREVVDHVPIAPPIGWFKQPSMFDQVRNMVRSEHMRMYAEARGAETFEEASDFEVEDEMFPTSQFEDERDFEPLEDLQARRQAEFEREYNKMRERRKREKEAREWAAEDAENTSSKPRKPGVEGGERASGAGSPKNPARAPSEPQNPPHSTST